MDIKWAALLSVGPEVREYIGVMDEYVVKDAWIKVSKVIGFRF